MHPDDDVLEPNVDKQGRICDAQGRPLRNRRNRNYGTQPFKGHDGSPHPREKNLAARIKGFSDLKVTAGKKQPGSYKK